MVLVSLLIAISVYSKDIGKTLIPPDRIGNDDSVLARYGCEPCYPETEKELIAYGGGWDPIPFSIDDDDNVLAKWNWLPKKNADEEISDIPLFREKNIAKKSLDQDFDEAKFVAKR
ncbi:MAG: hypothetical protein ACRC5M_00715 [Anaeroplasmataceae bacterium]